MIHALVHSLNGAYHLCNIFECLSPLARLLSQDKRATEDFTFCEGKTPEECVLDLNSPLDPKRIDHAQWLFNQPDSGCHSLKKVFRKIDLKIHPDKCEQKSQKVCDTLFKAYNMALETICLHPR